MEKDDDKEVVIHGNCTAGSLAIDTSSIAAGSVYYSDGSTWQLSDNIKSERIATESEIKALDERLAKVEKRLAILNEPDAKLLDTYPGLREAYDAYKVIEKLVEGNND